MAQAQQYNFDITTPAAPPPAPDKPKDQAPKGQSKYTFDISSAAAPPSSGFAEPPQPKGDTTPRDDRGIFTKPLFGSSVALYDKIVKLSPDAGYAARLTKELMAGGPEILDALQSPAGIGILAAHAIPVTRPFAMMGDVAMGWYQAAKAVPSVIKAGQDLGDPEKVARAVKDTLFAYGLVAGGRRGLKAGDVAEERPRSERARAALKRLEEIAPAKSDKKAKVAAKKAERAGIWRAAETPASGKEALAAKIYRNPVLSQVAGAIGMPKPTATEIGQRVVNDRLNFINVENTNAARAHALLMRDVPIEDLDVEKLGYVIQGDLTPEQAGISPAAVKALRDVIHPFQHHEVELARKTYGSGAKLQEAESYLAQMWDMDDYMEQMGKDPEKLHQGSQALTGVARRLMKDPYLKGRKVKGYREGMEIGLTDPETGEPVIGVSGEPVILKPKFRNVADIMYHRHLVLTRAAANNITAKRLYDIGAIVGPKKARALGVDHWPVASDSPALDRAVYSGKKTRTKAVPSEIEGQPDKAVTKETVTLKARPVHVNPNIKMAVDAMFAHGLEGTALKYLYAPMEQIRSYSKVMSVALSMFHENALSEQAQAVMATRSPMKALKSTFFLNKWWHRGMRSGLYKLIGKQQVDMPPHLQLDPEQVNRALRSGLEITSSDSESAFIKKLREVGKQPGKVPGRKVWGPLMRRMGDALSIGNHALWTYYYPGAMLEGFETIRTAELAKIPNATPEEVAALDEQYASHINKVFGAESMERMMLHPMTRQALQFALFAPLWSLSNIRVLTAGFENETQKKLRNRWAIGGAITWFASTEILNYALSSWFGGTDKNGVHHAPGSPGWFSWDNPGMPMMIGDKDVPGLTENAVNVFAGHNSDDSIRYIRLGKNFREPFVDMLSPLTAFGNKMSRPVRAGFEFATGHEPGSGFEVINKDATEEQKATQRLFVVLGLFVPFTGDEQLHKIQRILLPDVTPETTGSSTALGLPLVKGVTPSRAVRAYDYAKRIGRDDLAEKVLEAASLNHISEHKIVGAWRQLQRKRRHTTRGIQQKYDSHGEEVQEAPPAPSKKQYQYDLGQQ